MNLYEVSFFKNGVCQSNLVKSEKNIKDVEILFKKYKKDTEVLGIHIATSDSLKPGKPCIIL